MSRPVLGRPTRRTAWTCRSPVRGADRHRARGRARRRRPPAHPARAAAATGTDQIGGVPEPAHRRRVAEGIDAVVNLAGAGIGDHRWTDAYKLEILRSRTKSTVLLAGALADLGKPPSVLVSGSAIGFYGDRGRALDEASAAGTGFLPEVCVAWEAATVAAEEAGIRVAHLRTGIVLSGNS